MRPLTPKVLLQSTQCLFKQSSLPSRLAQRPFSIQSHLRRHQSSSSPSSHNFLDPITAHRVEAKLRSYYTRRSYYAAFGAVLCTLASLALVSTIDIESAKQADRSDSPRGSVGLDRANALLGGVSGGAEVKKQAEEEKEAGTARETNRQGDEDVELVETGTSTVPHFPRTLVLPTEKSSSSPALPVGTGSANDSYQLLGLGIRTVSFLSIQVYVVGIYVATSDISSLQSRLVRRVAGTETASTLVANEKDSLRAMLLDAEGGEQIWDEVLREGGIRTVVRIVPTRNTDFGHLRDGWVRGITARSQVRSRKQAGALGGAAQESYDDEAFGKSVGEFKQIFGGAGRKGVGKGKVLMLGRDANGGLGAWVEGESAEGFVRLGEVTDERISRLVWLGYLAGKSVASEAARKSVVDGILELVERPVGTVETQVL